MNKIFNSLVEHYDSTRYEVGKVFGLDNVFHITEKREDGQHIEVLVGCNEESGQIEVECNVNGDIVSHMEFNRFRHSVNDVVNLVMRYVKWGFHVASYVK